MPEYMRERLIRPDLDACRERDRVTHAAWGASLTLEQYLAREQRLRAHPWAREGMRTWFLASARGEVLSSCETFQMESRMESALSGRPGHIYGIASVFTEAAQRGKGYASRMIRGMIEDLESEDPEFQGMVLFSEVGDRLYGRLGFEVVESLEWLVKEPFSVPKRASQSVTRIENGSTQALALLRDYRELSMDFHVRPTWSQLDWHWERSRIYAELLERELPAFQVLQHEQGYSFWAADFKNGKFRALVFVAETVEAWLAMAHEAAVEGRRVGLHEVSIWHTPRVIAPELRAELVSRPGIELAPRVDELTMVRFGKRRPDRSWAEVPRALWI